MTVYAWPGWGAERFELRIIPNLRTFAGPYTPTTQVLDLLGERWAARIDLPMTNDPITAAAREAFFDRLKGMVHQIALWHLKLTAPQGTLRGSPVLNAAVAQLANAAVISTLAGRTVRAGDMLGIAGQLVRVMADATADSGGLLSVEFQPRARVAWAASSSVVWSQPTANFMLKAADGVSTAWVPGFAQGCSFELIEVP